MANKDHTIWRAWPPAGCWLCVPGLGTAQVLEHADPSLIHLVTARGTRLSVGEKALRYLLLGECYSGNTLPTISESASCTRHVPCNTLDDS